MKTPKTNKRMIGEQGEILALQYLQNRGFVCVERNFYTRAGEIDLICLFDEVLYFIEVKYRKSVRYGTPRDAITPQKYNRMRLTAQYYLKQDFLPRHQKICFSFLGILEKSDKSLVYDWVESIEI